MEKIIYYHNGIRYRKLKRDEEIRVGAVQSWAGGKLQPIMNPADTLGCTPSEYSEERDFYNFDIREK